MDESSDLAEDFAPADTAVVPAPAIVEPRVATVLETVLPTDAMIEAGAAVATPTVRNSVETSAEPSDGAADLRSAASSAAASSSAAVLTTAAVGESATATPSETVATDGAIAKQQSNSEPGVERAPQAVLPLAREEARRSSAAADASRARPTIASAAMNPATDPLAKLIESARIVVERGVVDQKGASASAQAIAGRLNEVEVSVARDRIAKTLGGGQPEQQDGVTQAASTQTAASNANGAAMPNAIQPGAVSSLPIGAETADGMPMPAPATDIEAHPSAQLAAKGVAILGNQRGGAITMRLEPPALGQLRIELNISQGAVVADFTTATPEARVLLEANLGMLRERLESQGLTVERISVHGGRGTESAAPATASGGSDARQEGAGARSDGGDRGDRSGTRQDAAGGESRGRRDSDARAQRDRTDAARQGDTRGFAAALHGETALRTEPMRRAG